VLGSSCSPRPSPRLRAWRGAAAPGVGWRLHVRAGGRGRCPAGAATSADRHGPGAPGLQPCTLFFSFMGRTRARSGYVLPCPSVPFNAPQTTLLPAGCPPPPRTRGGRGGTQRSPHAMPGSQRGCELAGRAAVASSGAPAITIARGSPALCGPALCGPHGVRSLGALGASRPSPAGPTAGPVTRWGHTCTRTDTQQAPLRCNALPAARCEVLGGWVTRGGVATGVVSSRAAAPGRARDAPRPVRPPLCALIAY
jgi:hypothetical protein